LLLADALRLAGAERVEFEAAANHARGRQQRIHDGLPTRHNLPTRLTSFVDRFEEIAEIKRLLKTHRLVTITGSGGVGKTRVAVEAAKELIDEGQSDIWFVDLSPVSDGTYVAGAVATALLIPLPQGGDQLVSLAARLKSRKLLLIIDNCEHVVSDAAAVASSLLRACPDIAILATSRERLAIEGERVYRLPSLGVPAKSPATVEEAYSYAALQLLTERALAIDRRCVLTAERVSTVAEICRQLEGLPLAIELAATRLPFLGFDALNRQLKEHFEITGIARDLPRRQQTIFSTIAWSYALLAERERMLLRRLAVFNGGATLEAAVIVCADSSLTASNVPDLLSLLVDKSLLTVTAVNDQSRYTMLESIRAFASSKLLEAGEVVTMSRAHAAWLAGMAERGDARFRETTTDHWLHEFGSEIDNVRSALSWALGSREYEDALLAAKIIGGFRGFWITTERHSEGRRWVEEALSRVDETRDSPFAANLMIAHMQLVDESERLKTGLRVLPFLESVVDRGVIGRMHSFLALEYSLAGEFAEADESIAQAFAIATEIGFGARALVRLLVDRSGIRARAGRFDEARADLAVAARLRDALGDENLMSQLYWEAYVEFAGSNVRRSAELLETCLDVCRSQSRNLALVLPELATARLILGEVDAARAAAREALDLARFERNLALRAIWQVAAITAILGQPRTGARLIGFAMAETERQRRPADHYFAASHKILMASLSKQLSNDVISRLSSEATFLDLEQAVDEAAQALAPG
jgi:predicted ATPase